MDQINRLMPIEDDRFIVIEGQSRLAMMASDAVLCASGTTTLEAMLIGKPMTIAYKMAWLSWQLLAEWSRRLTWGCQMLLLVVV